jgi:hypothetical protein
MKPGQEITLEIEPGKSLIIKFLAVGEADSEGRPPVFFELNGVPRQVPVHDRALKQSKETRATADPDIGATSGAPMPGKVVHVLVSVGQQVARGQKLLGTRGDEDGTSVYSPIAARVKEVHAQGRRRGRVEGAPSSSWSPSPAPRVRRAARALSGKQHLHALRSSSSEYGALRSSSAPGVERLPPSWPSRGGRRAGLPGRSGRVFHLPDEGVFVPHFAHLADDDQVPASSRRRPSRRRGGRTRGDEVAPPDEQVVETVQPLKVVRDDQEQRLPFVDHGGFPPPWWQRPRRYTPSSDPRSSLKWKAGPLQGPPSFLFRTD